MEFDLIAIVSVFQCGVYSQLHIEYHQVLNNINCFFFCSIYGRHSNGTADEGDDQPDDAQSLSRSASENSVALAQHEHERNNNNNNSNNNNNNSTNNDSINGYVTVIFLITDRCYGYRSAQQRIHHKYIFYTIRNFARSSASPESGLGTSHTSLHGSGQESSNEQMLSDDVYYELDPLEPLGVCKALYAFAGMFKFRYFGSLTNHETFYL